MDCDRQTLVQVRIRFCLTNDDQDDRQNGRSLSVCTSGHSALVFHYPIASKVSKGAKIRNR